MYGKRKFFRVFSFLLAAVCCCPALTAAQPRGDEPEKIRRMVAAVLEEISETDRKIAGNKTDPDVAPARLYAERGKLYVKLYRTRYLTKYLSAFYGEKTLGLGVSEITTKAIADFNKATGKTPAPAAAELLKLRGEMYAIRWFDFASSFRWREQIENYRREEIKKTYGEEWGDIVEKILIHNWTSRKKAESMAVEKFLANRDFEAARADFQGALKSSTGSAAAAAAGLAKETHENLGRLFMTRAGQVNQVESNRNLLVRPNRSDYSILDDLDRGISHLREAGDLDEDHAGGDLIRHTFYENFASSYAYWYKLPTLRTALFLKALIVSTFGDDATALKTLLETEKLIDKNAQDGFVCNFYPFRSRVYLRLKNFDRAFADASVTGYAENRICDESFETRGDVFFERGDFRAAVENYAARLATNGGERNSEIYKKLATARLKLNDTEKAISDLTNALESLPARNFLVHHSPAEYNKRRIELLKFRGSLYRQIGDEKNAAKDAEVIKKETEQPPYSCERWVYGKIILPAGVKISQISISVTMVYDDEKDEFGISGADEKGRFYLTCLKNKPFDLRVGFDTLKDGNPVRYYASRRFGRENKFHGPVIVNLNKFVKRNADEGDN